MSKYLEFVEGSFTQEHFDRQNEYPYVAYSVAEDRVIYSIVKTENGYSVTYLKRTSSFPTDYVEVDLGLPSGKKWLDRNVGAESPLDNGGYFSWGNSEGVLKVTETMSLDEVTKLLIGDSYTEEDKEQVKSDIELGLLENGNIDRLAQYPFGDWDSYNETFGSKLEVIYNDNDSYTVIDHNDNDRVIAEGVSYEQLREVEVPLSYDIMYTISNGQYKMPTRDDFIEMCNNTTITAICEDSNGNRYDLKFETEDGIYFSQVNQLPEGVGAWNLKLVEGIKFTASNGNSISMPASGNCYSFSPSGGCGLEGGNSYKPSGSSYLSYLGTYGGYWSSSLNYGGDSYQLLFIGNNLSADYIDSRDNGYCVRGLK